MRYLSVKYWAELLTLSITVIRQKQTARRVISVLCVTAYILVGGPQVASGFTITKLIEVGKGESAASGTLKWSPDGRRLAYFHDNSLILSDTLGQSYEIALLDLPPWRYEWLSNEEIVLHLKKYKTNHEIPSDTNNLVKIDVVSGEVILLRQYARVGDKNPEGDPNSYYGPRLSLEGNLYVRTNVIRGPFVIGEEGIWFPKSERSAKSDGLQPGDNHLVSWGDDGLYLIKGDLTDSNRIAPKPYKHMILPPVLSPDMSHYIAGGTIYRFADSTYIVLDTLVKERPPDTFGCGFLFPSFNPKHPEVLFNLICEGDDPYRVERIGTYNYITGDFAIIDPFPEMRDCERPSYSPDGRKVAFISDGTVFIIIGEQ